MSHEVTLRSSRQGLVFVGHGVELALSHDQLQVLALLKLWRAGAGKKEVRDDFFDRPGYTRRTRRPLTASERAAFCRTVRRLEAKQLLVQLVEEGRGYRFTCLVLSDAGKRLIEWTTQEWDGWQRYLEQYRDQWSQKAIREANLTAEENAKQQAAALAEIEQALTRLL